MSARHAIRPDDGDLLRARPGVACSGVSRLAADVFTWLGWERPVGPPGVEITARSPPVAYDLRLYRLTHRFIDEPPE